MRFLGSLFRRRVHEIADLIEAVDAGDLDRVETILASGVDVNGRMNDGWFPLLVAAVGTIEVVRVLVENHADVNQADEVGYTPLHRAAAHGREDVVELLGRHGASAGRANASGQTPIDLAVGGHHRGTIALLEKLLRCRIRRCDDLTGAVGSRIFA